MPTIFVAISRNLGEWAADVGLTKHVFKVGITDGDPKDAVEQLNQTTHAGQTDWQLIGKQAVEGIDEAAIEERIARKEKLVDPGLYPKIRGARGIFKVKPTNVENHLLVKMALEGGEPKAVKIKPKDVGNYLILNATK